MVTLGQSNHDSPPQHHSPPGQYSTRRSDLEEYGDVQEVELLSLLKHKNPVNGHRTFNLSLANSQLEIYVAACNVF